MYYARRIVRRLTADCLQAKGGNRLSKASQGERPDRVGVCQLRHLVLGLGVVAWVVGLLWIFPVAWTVLTSFKTEDDASAQTLHHGQIEDLLFTPRQERCVGRPD